jgi:hypothetical protein
MGKAPVLAFACSLMVAGHAQAMSYGLVGLRGAGTALVAEGRIYRNEAARLQAFVEQMSAVREIPRTLVISSPGGELVGALALGETLRQLGVRTVVGAISADAQGQATLGAGRCHSACVFVLMGGTSRSVIPGSLVGVHSPQPVMLVGGRPYLPDSATTRHIVQQTAPALRLYAHQMGVSPSLIDVANDVPHTLVRNLSSSELTRYSLITPGKSRKAVPSHQALRRQRSPD